MNREKGITFELFDSVTFWQNKKNTKSKFLKEIINSKHFIPKVIYAKKVT